jgi:hypothetical protein
VQMHPQRNAWLDPTDSIIATMQAMPDTSIRVTEQGVLIDGRLVPVLQHWESNEATREYVRASPRFRLDGVAPPRDAVSADNAVVAFYHRQRDANRLRPFMESLRNVGYVGGLHCVGTFDRSDLAMLSQFNCAAYSIAATDPAVADNIAHFYLSQTLDRLATEHAPPPDQVMTFDSVRAVFLRDPFVSKTIGLSAFCEGPVRIGESDYNRYRLSLFVPPDERYLQRPVISSSMLRGPLPVVREFYRRLLLEFIGRQDLLGTERVIQGAFNKLAYDSYNFPVIVHPHAAEAFFESLPNNLGVDTRQVIRIGGTAPAVVLSTSRDTGLMRKIEINLGLQ